MVEENIEVLFFIAQFMPYIIACLIIVHLYYALALFKIARSTNTKWSWLAWIPIVNLVLVANVARMRWWPVLLILLFPFTVANYISLRVLGIIATLALVTFIIIWYWKLLVKINRPGWWVLISLVPVIGWIIFLVLFGIAAFSLKAAQKTEVIPQVMPQKPSPQPKPQVVKPERIDRIDKLKKSLGQK